jgi:ubiquinone/menaquinone biosynthesis C-methylase UbiE
MQREVLTAQFVAGLRGLGLLRSWPFLDADAAELLLRRLRDDAGGVERQSLDVFETDRGYAAWSASYDDRLNPLVLTEHPAMSTILDDIPPGRALDAACGTGRLTRLLLQRGHSVTGVDTSEEMLAKARTSAPAATYQLASLEALPFADGAFDLVVCGLALTHFASLGPVIAELTRVLGGTGHLVISDVHPVAVATGGHAFFRSTDGARCVVRNELHWHGEYFDAFKANGLRVRRCVEPLFAQHVLEAILSQGASSALEHVVGLPYVLIWECAL